MFSFDLDRALAQLVYDPKSPLLFSSGLFLFLFLIFATVYRALLSRERLRVYWCIAFSLFFYYKSSGWYWLLLVVSVLIDFYAARAIESGRSQKRKRLYLVVSLIANLGLLGYFKYANYFAGLIAALTGQTFSPWDIFLPVGISFFTFQSMSYTIDVYRGQLKALDNIWDFGFYVSFFPQMVAGPIVRASDFLPQMRHAPFVSREDFGRGIYLFCIGLFKKAVISDYISANFVDRVFLEPERYSGLENLLGVYGYAMQIYCDFSGYSDMAIGIGLLLGFRFPPNFNAPYRSRSVTEFWRRWHISLSTWLRDYLYISLGGNRGGAWRTYRNLMLTMLLGGLWHGAATRFILWGGLHGLALALERWFRSVNPRAPGPLRQILGGLLTFHFVCLCWILFRAEDMAHAGAMLSQIAFDFRPEGWAVLLSGYAPTVFLISLGYALHFLPDEWDRTAERLLTHAPLILQAAAIALVAAIVMQVKSADVQPFIYFQF
ncbi:MAG: MBOAT family O-acyltransferase [Saprospiraceae bacterium]